MSESEISNLNLSVELMSSEDENSIVHVPQWRTLEATQLFIKTDSIYRKKAKSFSRYEGNASTRPLPASLRNHSMVL